MSEVPLYSSLEGCVLVHASPLRVVCCFEILNTAIETLKPGSMLVGDEGSPSCVDARAVQWYLAHKKQPPPVRPYSETKPRALWWS